MSRNAPQFRVQAEEITSQGRDGKYLHAAAEVRPRRISRAHDTYGRARQGFLACRRACFAPFPCGNH